MFRRLCVVSATLLLLVVFVPTPARAHTRSWIGTDLNVTHHWRVRGGTTGYAVEGYLTVTNKRASARNIECTLRTVYSSVLSDDVAPGESVDLDFFMAARNLRQDPTIVHCHRGTPSGEPAEGLSRRI
jgi:hypothetical protein